MPRLFFLSCALLVFASSATCAAVPDDRAASDGLHPAAEQLSAHCSTSVDEALKAARAALARDDAEGNHAALVCLLAATSALNTERLDAVRGAAGAEVHMLAVPKDSPDGR